MNWKMLNPLNWIKKLNNAFVKFENMGREGLFELANDLSNEENVIHCRYCGHLLSILKMPILIKSVEIGETYRVKCSHCKKYNVIIKTCKNW